MEKTNVMRQFDRKKLPYSVHSYEGVISGAEVAAYLRQDPDTVFKTLVTTGKSGAHYVFMIPVREELDLKKAAAAVGEKSIVMLPQKELLPLTGYIHGGCSPVGMKKLSRSSPDSWNRSFSAQAGSACRSAPHPKHWKL